MPIVILLLSLLLVPSLVLAEDIYVAQKTAGFDDGSSCANAHAATWFNTAGNWGVGAGKISGGDTAHFCGTITIQMIVQASGSAGSPITILFESGAKLSQPVCPALNGCLRITERSFIIVDGGANGIIESTANGTAPTYANQAWSAGIGATPCSNCEFKNLTIRNMYVHLYDLTDDVVSAGNVNCIRLSGTNWTFHHNICHDAGRGIDYSYQNGDSGMEVHHNEIYRIDDGMTLAGVGAISASNMKFYNNHVHTYDNWDTNSNLYHHDGFQSWAQNGAVFNGLAIYNNFFDGPCGDNMTGHIFLTGQTGWEWTLTGTVQIYNNVLRCNSVVHGIVGIHSGRREIYNNTIIGSGVDNGTCLALRKSLDIIIKNNAITGCRFLLDLGGTVANPATDINYNTYGLCGALNCFSWEGVSPFTKLFSTWQTNCGCDGNSTKHANLVFDSIGSPPAGSPVIGTGTNLSSLSISDLNRDKMLIARPSIGAWTVGAYHLASDTVLPAPPTGLTVR